ncbi:MAG: hypothetical protein NZM06_08395 [Chloroherpetonaceae bacterium]|nr:hypothetical protein [Chloroherpetonaceae bacterium]MDW8437402.1 hypothetical protein [Chloroherpetonaceae bacterium]
MPLPFDISPDALWRKTLQAFTKNEAETSENPEYIELKTRRYRAAMRDVYEVALSLPPRWFGWRVVSREKNLGGMSAFKCEITSAVLGGNRLELSVWMMEEPDASGGVATVVNAKCVSRAPTKGDLGECRRNIAFFLFALDDAFAPVSAPAPKSEPEPLRADAKPSEQPAPRPRVTIKQGGAQRIAIKQSTPEK